MVVLMEDGMDVIVDDPEAVVEVTLVVEGCKVVVEGTEMVVDEIAEPREVFDDWAVEAVEAFDVADVPLGTEYGTDVDVLTPVEAVPVDCVVEPPV
jgi:hypothetical protein